MDKEFDSYSIPQKFENYCLIIEKMFNQDDEKLKKFAFKIFDLHADGVLDYKDMFDLMHNTSSNHSKVYMLQPEE